MERKRDDSRDGVFRGEEGRQEKKRLELRGR